MPLVFLLALRPLLSSPLSFPLLSLLLSSPLLSSPLLPFPLFLVKSDLLYSSFPTRVPSLRPTRASLRLFYTIVWLGSPYVPMQRGLLRTSHFVSHRSAFTPALRSTHLGLQRWCSGGGRDGSTHTHAVEHSEGDKSATTHRIPGAMHGPNERYVILYTCNVCETRSAQSFTKVRVVEGTGDLPLTMRSLEQKAYHEGVVLVRCGGCDNLHLIADNLGWFEDEKTNIEDLMAKKGSSVRAIKPNEPFEATPEDVELLTGSKPETEPNE